MNYGVQHAYLPEDGDYSGRMITDLERAMVRELGLRPLLVGYGYRFRGCFTDPREVSRAMLATEKKQALLGRALRRARSCQKKWYSKDRLMSISGAKEEKACGYFCRRKGAIRFVYLESPLEARYLPSYENLFDAPAKDAPFEERLEYAKDFLTAHNRWVLFTLFEHEEMPRLLSSNVPGAAVYAQEVLDGTDSFDAGFEESQEAVLEYTACDRLWDKAVRVHAHYVSLVRRNILNTVLKHGNLKRPERADHRAGPHLVYLDIPGYKKFKARRLLVILNLSSNVSLIHFQDASSIPTICAEED